MELACDTDTKLDGLYGLELNECRLATELTGVNAVTAAGEAFVKATDAYVGALVTTATAAAGRIAAAVTSVVTSWQSTQKTHYADYVAAVISAGLNRWQGDLAGDLCHDIRIQAHHEQ